MPTIELFSINLISKMSLLICNALYIKLSKISPLLFKAIIEKFFLYDLSSKQGSINPISQREYPPGYSKLLENKAPFLVNKL
jgi:hypothetical protein